MSGVDIASEAETERLRSRLAAEVASDGYRLGVIVIDGDVVAERYATELLESVGLLPLRRLARMRPRPGETRLRPEDLTDFVERYGHEYIAVFASPSVFASTGQRLQFERASSREGCEVLWHDVHSHEPMTTDGEVSI